MRGSSRRSRNYTCTHFYDIVRKLPDEAMIELESKEGKKLGIKSDINFFFIDVSSSQ